MAERGSRKIPVTERQFLWVQDDDKGEVVLHVGPTMVSPTAADRVVVSDGCGGFREDRSGQPQQMVELSDGEYAVLHNPLAERRGDEGSNGSVRPGRNEARALANGTRHMIPGPCAFYLRPGQRVEVREAHELASNQYLVVKVYGVVDTAAPYFEITARSAGITSATAEDVGEGAGDRGGLEDFEPVALTRGQLIVIRGLDTQFYIPPTGVDVVPDEDDADHGEATVQATIATPSAAVRPQPVRRADDDEDDEDASDDEAFIWRARAQPGPQRRAAAPPRLVRRAVVLGEKAFCVVVDADGRRQIKAGPARVFPGPYDSFLTEGSSDRIYHAYELLPRRALWLRFISPISREELAQKLPRGVELERDHYHPGDELLITGLNTFFFPFIEAEILHPLTGRPHVGNDHGDVFIAVIGIDQKSGIYVRDLLTGEVRLIRGKQSYLVDPRKEVHITRRVSATEWNLWVAPGEPQKQSSSAVVTPWAISVSIPHNTAVMAASASGHRVIEGPCVELLEYDEHLVRMSLSSGRPKGTEQPVSTCFLRTSGNVVTDEIRAETTDFVQISVRVACRVTFDPSHRERWFDHLDYVGLLTDHLRSMVRRRVRQQRLTDLWPRLSDEIRDLILGERGDDGRRGRFFEENGMLVTEVEVLESEILDDEIGEFLEEVQRESVSLQISDRQAQEQLRSEALRHRIALERLQLLREQQARQAEVDAQTRALELEALLGEVRNEEAVALEAAERSAAREKRVLEAELERRAASTTAGAARRREAAAAAVETLRAEHVAETEHTAALARTEMALIAARAEASVAEREAVQPGLIEALNGLGDRELLAESARNMNLVSLVKGRDVASLFAEVFGSTKVGRSLASMLPTEEASE